MSTHSPSLTDQSVSSLDVGDPLADIDRIMDKRLADEQRLAEQSASLKADRTEFGIEFLDVCAREVRPPMEAILERLRHNGGGGVIEERSEDVRRGYDHRLTLWMSLSGELQGAPRPDRDPYLQLDADVGKRVVMISEGDMWQGQGGNRSGKVAEWQLAEITSDRVTQEIVAIVRRSVG